MASNSVKTEADRKFKIVCQNWSNDNKLITNFVSVNRDEMSVRTMPGRKKWQLNLKSEIKIYHL